MTERTLLAFVADAFLVVDALKMMKVECLLFVTLSMFELERNWLSVVPGRLLHKWRHSRDMFLSSLFQ